MNRSITSPRPAETRKIIVHSASPETSAHFLKTLSRLWPSSLAEELVEYQAGPAATLNLSLQTAEPTGAGRWQWSTLLRGESQPGVRQLFYRQVRAVLFLVENDMDQLSASLSAGRRLVQDLAQVQVAQVPCVLGYTRLAHSVAQLAPLEYLQSLFNALTPMLPYYEIEAESGANHFALAERLMRGDASA
jgi:hypothetical protein